MIKRFIWILVIVSALVAAAVGAQQSFTEQDAVDLAAGHPAFAEGLDANPGWTAAAYDTENDYGIWHVQFWDGSGEDLGWADVSPARERVYTWETHFGATDTQRSAAETILIDFVAGLPEVNDLIDDPAQYNMYVDYNGWAQAWGVYLDRGEDSLYILVRFAGIVPSSLDNPQLVSISFPEIMSYEDWRESKQALAIATAFQNPDISAALQDVDNWTTSAEKQDENVWMVTFMGNDSTLAQVTVDLTTETIVDYSIGG